MDSKEQLSVKKKKDLVEIAVHFGFLSQTKANAMTKAALIDYLVDKNSNVSSVEAKSEVLTSDEEAIDERQTIEDNSSDSEVSDIYKDSVPEKKPSNSTQKTSSRTGRSRSSRSKDSDKSVSSKGNISRKVKDKYDMTEAEAEVETIQAENGAVDSSSSQPVEVESDKIEIQRKTKSRRRSIIIQPKEPDNEMTEDTTPADSDAQPSAKADNVEEKSSSGPRTLKVKEPEPEMITGVLEIMSDGFGFIRRDNYLPSNSDVFIHSNYIRRFGLRTGDLITGPVRPKKPSDKYAPLQYIKEVNEQPPEKMLRRPHFEKLTPIYPDERFVLETQKTELSTRIIDLIAPIGKGQRGMIVSPPKAGKTILLQKIANAISINNPDSKLIVLLIDERPEEVTDMQRSINGEVVYSTFDKKPENHTKIVELVLERAMRLVEIGQDVVILLDSMTRLSRAYNLTINPTGRTLSGGLDPGALYGPKRFFGAARNIENGGSLTIIATSLIETGSRMDEVIFEEFKGTGNMEVYLDRKLSEKRIFPAIDINKSGTRREDLLLASNELDAVWTIRKAFSQLDTSAVTEMIISLLLKTQTNQQFVQSVNVSFNDKALFDAMRGGARPAGTSSTTNGNGK